MASSPTRAPPMPPPPRGITIRGRGSWPPSSMPTGAAARIPIAATGSWVKLVEGALFRAIDMADKEEYLGTIDMVSVDPIEKCMRLHIVDGMLWSDTRARLDWLITKLKICMQFV